MTENEAFLANIRENPDDDLPRLIYADWLTDRDDPRGEFIRLQCEAAKLDDDDPRRPALLSRAKSLLRKHNRTWRADLPQLRGIRWGGFERGFIGSAMGSVHNLREALPALLDVAPTAELKVRSVTRGDLRRLFASPHASRIRALAVEPGFSLPVSVTEITDSPHAVGLRSLTFTRMGDGSTGAQELAGSPHLSGLRRLVLNHCRLDDRAAVALAESTSLGSLCRLDLAGNGIGPNGVRALAATTRFRLNELNLRDNPIGPNGARALAEATGLKELTHLTLGGYRHQLGNSDELLATRQLPRLASLELDRAEAAAWREEVLAAATRGMALRRLVLRHTHLDSQAVRKIAGCPRLDDLRELVLEWTQLRGVGVAALATSPYLADLRVLRLQSNLIGNKGATALARGPWRRLEVVDLSWNEIRDAGVVTLVASPLGKHTSVLNLDRNRFGKAGRDALSRRRVRAWPLKEESA